MIRLLNSASRRARAKAHAGPGAKRPGSRKLSLTAARLRRCPLSYPGAPQPAAPSRAPPPSLIHFTIRTALIPQSPLIGLPQCAVHFSGHSDSAYISIQQYSCALIQLILRKREPLLSDLQMHFPQRQPELLPLQVHLTFQHLMKRFQRFLMLFRLQFFPLFQVLLRLMMEFQTWILRP